MRFDIITIFPDMFGSVFSSGVLGKAVERGVLDIAVHDLRRYARDKHRQVDDRPFGGDQGMVFKPEPVFAAVEDLRRNGTSPVLLLSPQGKKFDHRFAEKLAGCAQVLLICGRYEGVDERIVRHLATDEISIGDYILTGGEPAAVVIVDAVSRFVPGVVGKEESVRQDSFSQGFLDHPQYTRPRRFRDFKVPEVLLSGDHKEIAAWRRRESLRKTLRVRPDLLEEHPLSPEDQRLLEEIQSERKDEK